MMSQEPVPGSSKEANASPDISLFNRLPPEVFGENMFLNYVIYILRKGKLLLFFKIKI